MSPALGGGGDSDPPVAMPMDIGDLIKKTASLSFRTGYSYCHVRVHVKLPPFYGCSQEHFPSIVTFYYYLSPLKITKITRRELEASKSTCGTQNFFTDTQNLCLDITARQKLNKNLLP